MDKNLPNYPLSVPAPHHYTFAVPAGPPPTIAPRGRAPEAPPHNTVARPAQLLAGFFPISFWEPRSWEL